MQQYSTLKKRKLDESDTIKGQINKMWGKCGDNKNKKPSYINNMKVFITTKVVRTGIEPVFHP